MSTSRDPAREGRPRQARPNSVSVQPRTRNMRYFARFLSGLSNRSFAGGLATAGLAVGAALALGTQPACSSNGETLDRPCPPGEVCSVGLTILHTSDIHSRLYPYEQVITQVD